MALAFLQELVQVGLYKRSQGRITRQVTFIVVVVAVAYGLYQLSSGLMNLDGGAPWYAWMARIEWRYTIPALLLVAGAWAAFRLVNVPDFADFLIAVEAEMGKVSWPSRAELIKSCIVVLVMMLVLATVLFLFDFLWGSIFRSFGIIPSGAEETTMLF